MGKNYLPTVFGCALVKQGCRVLMVRVGDLVQRMQAAFRNQSIEIML